MVPEKRKTPPTKEEENNSKKQEVESLQDKKLNQRYGIGAQLMSRMGYVSGSGLGADNSGIINPIQSGSASAPGFQRAGLGMMSMAGSRYEEGYTSSSSEEDHDLTSGPKTVAFNKTNQTPKGNRTDITQLLDELSTDSVVDYFDIDSSVLITIKDSINKLDDQSFLREKLELKRQFVELNEITERLSQLNKEIPIVENEMYEMSELVNVLNYLKTTEISNFDECIHKILKLQNDEQVDKLIANQITRLLRDSEWGDIMDPENKIVKSLKDMVENLKYRLTTKKHILNRSQTELFMVVEKRFQPYCEKLMTSKKHEDYETLITLLLNFEGILKYVDLYDYTIDIYVTPVLVELIEPWELSTRYFNIGPRDWIAESLILGSERNDKTIRKVLLRWLKETRSIFDPNFDNKVISDLTFIYNYLMEQDARKTLECYSEFVLTFKNDYFMKNFTPENMNKSWDAKDDHFMAHQSTVRCVQMLRRYVNLFRPVHYNAFVDFIFNEINSILFKWLLYAEENDKKKAISWFNTFINCTFSNPLPNKSESEKIKKTFDFLKIWEQSNVLVQIHNEMNGYHKIPDLTVDDLLESEHIGGMSLKGDDERESSSDYTLNTLPIRMVTTSLKEVVQDYCEKNGFLIKKLPNGYAQLPYGKHQNSLVPVFEIINVDNKKRVNVSMKDDILWIQKEKTLEYSPIYLYKIAQLLQ